MEPSRRSGIRCSEGHLKATASSVISPEAVARYLQLHLAARQHEVFAVLFLDSQHRLIALEEMFRGTLTRISVY